MDIRFKLATLDTIPDVLKMMEAFYAIDEYPFDREITNGNLNRFIQDSNLGRLWLIIADEHVVGYIAFTFGFSFEYGGKNAFIDEFYIKEEWRGKGIGSEAIDFVTEQAKELEVGVVHLEVEKHNAKGTALYIKKDFGGNNRGLMTKVIE